MKNRGYSDSPINIGDDNRFEGDTVIGHGSQIIKDSVYYDDSKRYETNIQDITIVEGTAQFFIGHFGRRNTSIGGIISIISGFLTIISGLKSLFSTTENNPYNIFILTIFPSSETHGGIILLIGFFLFVFGLLLIGILQYQDDTKCGNCGRDFAYQEIERPFVIEKEISEGIHKTTFRTYKCRFCGYKIKRKYTEILKPSDSR